MNNKIGRIIKKIPLGAKSATVYTLATIFSRGLAIITMPIFTRLMSTDQIGVVNLYNSWYSLFSLIATLSLTSGGFSVAMKEFEGKRNQYISSILTLTSIMAGCMAIIYAFSHDFWNALTELPTSLMVLMLLGFFLSPARDFWLAYERYEYRYKSSAIVMFLSALLSSALSIIFVVSISGRGYENVAEGRLIANYIVLYAFDIVIWFLLMRKGKTYINLSYWKFSLSLSIPLLGYSIASQILSVSDRMMISRMVNNSAVGIYSTLYSVASLFSMVWTAVNSSFIPYLYQNIGEKNNRIKEFSFSILYIYAVAAVFMVFMSPEIVKILATSEYYEGIYIMPPIAVGVFLTSAANLYSNVLLYLKSSKYIMYASIIAAALNIVLNYIFIGIFGYMAAAYTTMLSYMVMFSLLYYWSNKLFLIKTSNSLNGIYDNNKILLLLTVETVILMSGIFLYRFATLRYFCTFLLIIFSFSLIKKYLGKLKVL